MAEDRIGAGQFDSTIGALREGVTSVAIQRAVAEVEAWQQRLQGSDDPLLAPIAGDLGALRGELTRETLDGAAISSLLYVLGDEVGQAASGDYPPAISDKLQHLADLLKSAADTLVNR